MASVRVELACSQAGRRGVLGTLRSLVKMMAPAPSEVGQHSRRRNGGITISDSITFSMVMSGIFSWACGFLRALSRSFTATIGPTCGGCAASLDVLVDRRGERDAGTAAGAAPEDAGGVRLGLLLERDGEHGLEQARLDEVGAEDGGVGADAAGGVHADHRLPGAAHRVGQEQLGLHHALELVRGLAEHDRLDVVPPHLGVVEGAAGRLPEQAGHGEVGTDPLVVGDADPDDRAAFGHLSHPP